LEASVIDTIEKLCTNEELRKEIWLAKNKDLVPKNTPLLEELIL